MPCDVYGSGIMATLARCTFGLPHPPLRHYPELQYSLITQQRAHWLRSLGLMPEPQGRVDRMVLLTPTAHTAIEHSEPLGYMMQHHAWMEYLRQSPQRRAPPEGAYTLIAAGAEPDFPLPSSIQTYRHDLKQHTSIIRVQHAYPHEHTAIQYFGREHILCSLPLNDPQESLWLLHQPQGADHRSYAPICSILGTYTVQQEAVPEPLHTLLRHPCISGQHILLGDTRCRLHPMAGQGLNLGIYALEDLYQRLYQPTVTLLDHQYSTEGHLRRLYACTRLLAYGQKYGLLAPLLSHCITLLDLSPSLRNTLKISADPIQHTWRRNHFHPANEEAPF